MYCCTLASDGDGVYQFLSIRNNANQNRQLRKDITNAHIHTLMHAALEALIMPIKSAGARLTFYTASSEMHSFMRLFIYRYDYHAYVEVSWSEP